ncbi:TrmH family RNA methyltransferase [Neolewinella agarilytica]|uniref:SpoU rRNA Methylase family protein n=1 Tax=Neolewinella agarilytica TaxID=478744 RepID=A0A1H9LPF4_9BACT|nr:TrmH family RNA methyltransferase [Neolewinella agarilytica]SER13296.1 SpoU rRNA Methylase family protein [Neolewinella agarilytica]
MEHRKKSMEELGRLSPEAFREAKKIPVSVLLDDIRSANNVGSIFRTADGFALAHLYLCGITATPPHRDILKTALGATQSVSWSHHEDAEALVKQLRGDGAQVQCLEQTEQSTLLRDFVAPAAQHLVIVVGNEVNGVSQAVIDASDGTIEIEQFGTKHSLNVAVATGMVVWRVSSLVR